MEHLIETVLFSTHNISKGRDIRKLIFNYILLSTISFHIRYQNNIPFQPVGYDKFTLCIKCYKFTLCIKGYVIQFSFIFTHDVVCNLWHSSAASKLLVQLSLVLLFLLQNSCNSGARRAYVQIA